MALNFLNIIFVTTCLLVFETSLCSHLLMHGQFGKWLNQLTSIISVFISAYIWGEWQIQSIFITIVYDHYPLPLSTLFHGLYLAQFKVKDCLFCTLSKTHKFLWHSWFSCLQWTFIAPECSHFGVLPHLHVSTCWSHCRNHGTNKSFGLCLLLCISLCFICKFVWW